MAASPLRRSNASGDSKFRRVLAPAAGILLSVVATILFAGVQQRAQKAQFDTASDNRILVIQRHIDSNVTLLKALAAYAGSTKDRDWNSMHEFVANFTPLGKDIVRYYWWNPALLPGAAQPLESYPLDSGRVVFDTKAIQRVVAQAADTGSEAALVLPGLRKMCLIAVAVDSGPGGNHAGEAVLLAFDISDLVEDALTVLHPSGIDLSIHDEHGIELHYHAALRASEALPLSRIFQPSPALWARSESISFADVHWSISCAPIDDYLSPLSVGVCWGVLFSGLLMTFLVDNGIQRRRRQHAATKELALLRAAQLAETQGRLAVETERKRSVEASLRRSEDRFRNAYRDAVIGFVMADSASALTVVNHSFCQMTGYSEEELIGRSIPELMAPDDRVQSSAQTQLLFSGAVPNYVATRRIQRRDGSIVCVRASVSLIEEDNARGLVALIEDLSGEMEARSELEFQATHDTLTGLCNRRAFEERLTLAIGRAAQNASGLALMYVDLDGFKFVNDSLGHTIGDRLLPAVAQRLSSRLDESATLSRVGGDEFTIILENGGGRPTIESTAECLLEQLRAPFLIEGRELFISASVGICRYPEDGQETVALVRYADAAMYEAKRKGRGRFCFFSQEMARTATARLTMESDLRRALERGELEVHFQPLLAGNGKNVVGMEALCRWRHPSHGYIRPDIFIPVAEETGLIVSIGRWVLAQACSQAVEWNRAFGFPIKVAVNVSVVQLAQGNFVREVAAVLQETGLPHALLELEITESAVMQNSDSAARILADLRELGISIALDDFGTGYSSLSRLRRLPLDTLKIDRSFIGDLTETGDSQQLVASLVSLAHGMGLQVVTEGVERHEQAHALTRLGCDLLQGFFFSRPLKPEDARDFIQRMTILSGQESLLSLTSAFEHQEHNTDLIQEQVV